MKVYALCSWYDEDPRHLGRLVRSLKGFADVLVAVDGAYATFPGATAESPSVQHGALSDAVRSAGLRPYLVTPDVPWAGGEVEKRAAMFEYARQAGATADDWLLIVDADMALGYGSADTLGLLEATDCDVAEVRWHNIQIDGKVAGEYRFRSMFRALPGLTVERTHWLYTVPRECGCGRNWQCPECYGFRQIDSRRTRRFMWLLPNGHPSDEPILDLFGHVTLHHFNSQRGGQRKRRALAYYADRDSRTLESAGDWR